MTVPSNGLTDLITKLADQLNDFDKRFVAYRKLDNQAEQMKNLQETLARLHKKVNAVLVGDIDSEVQEASAGVALIMACRPVALPGRLSVPRLPAAGASALPRRTLMGAASGFL